MSYTQLLTRDAYGVTYADPQNPNSTVRFKTYRTEKSLSGYRMTNYVTEIVVNDLVEISASGTAMTNEPISIRVRVSGSIKSHARRVAMLKKLATQLSSWADENVFLGFEPETVPEV